MENKVDEALSFKTKEGQKKFLYTYNQNLKLWDTSFDSFYVHTRFGRTNVIASGPISEPPVILLHGFGFSSAMWYPNVKSLNRNYRVYAVDVIGDLNKSVMESPMKGHSDYVLWFCDILDHLNIDKATVIGHSAGGWQTLNIAINAPERMNKMILLAPAASFVPFRKQFFVRQISSILFPFRPVVIDFVGKWFVAKGNTVNESLFEQFYLGIKHFRFSKIIIPSVFKDEELQKIDIPVLLLIGDKEVIYDPNQVIARALKLIPKLKFKIIPNAGHALSIEKAHLVNEEILNFLE
ncbi:alpha/beta fold hydrolase [Bacillus sp. S/N-304-OC-R1]|uniref:alpha/beta fold hydrolase n=1 Tax=Bacillus sp. S/N-304-OC-R1 TaxID=2758034 RepID=UPI001C8EAA12|nr:alpha/beta hydrolase [Bacillus sp. S/N-304-OC-R1]MBY0124548.1 alpha/beta hydrolase [Bacillus sp. S/N-304-OC-R1]